MDKPHVRRARTLDMHQQAASSRVKSHLKALFAATASIALGLAAPLFAQEQTVPGTEMTDLEWQLLEKKINDRANEIANSRQFFERDRRPITVVARLDRPSNALFMDLDVGFGEDVGDLPLEDFQGAIDVGLEELTAQISGFHTTMWRIGGRDMDYWFERQLEESGITKRAAITVAPSGSERPTIIVAAGHGAYFHSKYKWTMQRERVNDVLEDEITQVFARELSLFTGQNGAEAIRLRGASLAIEHQPSGMPWGSLAARYFLENWRPDNPEIWNTKSGSADPGRDRLQDIRSRPLYANFINARAIAHIHTNADSPSATGTRVLVHPGRAEDFRLAQLTLCSMKEMIHSDPQYASYFVPKEPLAIPKKGENSYAKVPSMIVEVGFHTNPSDAKILQDPNFQKLSMKGVAKGMRLHREGASCASFAVREIEPVTASIGRDARLPVTMTGNPVYPVSIRATQINCGKGKCRSKDKMVFSKSEADSYRFNHVCWQGDDEMSPIQYTVEAKDADGVRTPPVIHRVNCVRAG